MNTPRFISTKEAAKLLGISRVAVFKKIKKGEIKAEKVGRNYIIETAYLPPELFSSGTHEKNHDEIAEAVKKTVREYGETLRLLGKE